MASYMTSQSNARPGYVLCRYLAASLLMAYGFAKITGSQFTVPDSELDKPLRDVSGFWLTWYYFGYSAVYGTMIALVQIVGAMALLVRRTALIGACLLLPVVGNIILIDIFYGVDPGPLLVAILIAGCLMRVLYEHRDRLQALLLPPAQVSKRRAVLAWSVHAVIVVVTFSFAYYAANYNNRLPTPIDGTWAVAATPQNPQLPTHVYFERNRAFLCVLRYADKTIWHHFEVVPERAAVKIWTDWLTKGPLLLEGTYDSAGKTMVLAGRLPASPQPVRLQLSKTKPPG